jgi:transposase InsO family protein
MGHARSTHYEWRKRTEIQKPGPKGPDPDVLLTMMEEIEALDHVKRRTWGTEIVYEEYETVIPKNVISAAIEQARRRSNKVRRDGAQRYEIAAPNIAWSEDFIDVQEGGKVLRVQDDCTRMAFGTEHRLAWEQSNVCRFLEEAFRRYGLPFFFKHDRGGEFAGGLFQAFLRGHQIMALPSPPFSPWYNGKMERENLSIRQWLAPTVADRPTLADTLEEIRRSQLDNNLDRGKEALAGMTPAEAYASMPRPQLDRRGLYSEWESLVEKIKRDRWVRDKENPNTPVLVKERWGELTAMRLASITLMRRHQLVRYIVGPEVPDVT